MADATSGSNGAGSKLVRGLGLLDATMIVGGDIDLLSILGQPHARGKAGAELDSIDNLPLAFIEHNDRIRIRSHKESRRGRHAGKQCQQRNECLHSGYGNTRSRLRQSLVAVAHLLAQSGELLR